MFNINIFNMTIIANKPNCVKLDFGDGTYSVHPKGSLLVVADTDSEMINFKLSASRKTIYSVKNSDLIPNGGDVEETVELITPLLMN